MKWREVEWRSIQQVLFKNTEEILQKIWDKLKNNTEEIFPKLRQELKKNNEIVGNWNSDSD
jgi:translation elongation factor EF-G